MYCNFMTVPYSTSMRCIPSYPRQMPQSNQINSLNVTNSFFSVCLGSVSVSSRVLNGRELASCQLFTGQETFNVRLQLYSPYVSSVLLFIISYCNYISSRNYNKHTAIHPENVRIFSLTINICHFAKLQ